MAKISKGQLIKLQGKYITDKAIGKLFGISRQAVHQLRQKYGIAPIADKHTMRNTEIAEAYSNGMPCIKIARKYRMSISQAYRIIRNEKAG